MAFWYYTQYAQTLVMNPKCCSTSMRRTFDRTRDDMATVSQTSDNHLGGKKIAICLRDPIERLRSALACTTTPKNLWGKHKNLERLVRDMEDGKPIHTHVAPQVDYYNWRVEAPFGSTHALVPHSDGELHFEPDFVFWFTHVERDWKNLRSWLRLPPATLYREHAANGPKPDLAQYQERLEKIYAADYRLMDKLR